jgi:GxxExxY protein
MEFDQLSNKVIGCAIEVHRQIGPGLLESVYERCLKHELGLAGLSPATQVMLDLSYKGLTIRDAYRADMIVNNALLVEIKCVEQFSKNHEAQILTYLALAKLKTGLLLNFGSCSLKGGYPQIHLLIYLRVLPSFVSYLVKPKKNDSTPNAVIQSL